MSEEIVYVCDYCGDTFSLDEAGRIYCDGQPETVCPNCKSTDIEEGERCKVCREIYYSFDIMRGVCKDCFADAVSAWKRLFDYLEPWQREVLEDEYGNLDITEE